MKKYFYTKSGRSLLLFFFFVFINGKLFAHTINYALEGAPIHEISWFYFKLGFAHIIPQGIDHVLFIIALCMINTNIKSIIWQATAFTVAHTIALILSMKNVIIAPAPIIESVIALSIIFVSVENLLLSKLKPWRILLVFAFGLIHGLGFASALNETGLPPGKFYSSLLMFNLGVEVCQLLLITLVFITLILPFKNHSWYRPRIVYPISIFIGLAGFFWLIERMG
jgi:hypothetical protein